MELLWIVLGVGVVGGAGYGLWRLIRGGRGSASYDGGGDSGGSWGESDGGSDGGGDGGD